jgi:hypothetical protein
MYTTSVYFFGAVGRRFDFKKRCLIRPVLILLTYQSVQGKGLHTSMDTYEFNRLFYWVPVVLEIYLLTSGPSCGST